MDGDDHSKNPKFTFFLRCFGFSKKEKYSSKTTNKVRYRDRGFRQSTFLFKQSPTKTVPLDSNLSEKLQRNKKTFLLKKSDPKKKADDDIPLKSQTSAADTLKVITADQPQEKRSSFEKKVILENGELFESMIDPRPKNEAFRRKIDAIRNRSSQPGSPETKAKSYPTAILRSTSFPTPIPLNSAAKSRVTAKKTRKENETVTNKFDPVIGMSIIMVTLIIMLLWGRLCAILCTCAWLYFVPRLRNNGVNLNSDKTGLDAGEPDFNSEEQKKRVVLEGFLERNHKRSIS